MGVVLVAVAVLSCNIYTELMRSLLLIEIFICVRFVLVIPNV